MEGISHEAISLAGHLQARQADRAVRRQRHHDRRPTSLAVTDDQLARFKAAGWDAEGGRRPRPAAIAAALAKRDAPTAPSLADRLQDDDRLRRADQGRQGLDATAAPLGDDEIAGAREKWAGRTRRSTIPDEMLRAWRAAGQRGAEERASWEARLARPARPPRSAFERARPGELPSRPSTAAIAAAKAERWPRRPSAPPASRSQLALDHWSRRAGDDRRLGRPHRLQQHRAKEHEPFRHRQTSPATTSTTACASTAWPRP